jgi:hypothetical protein
MKEDEIKGTCSTHGGICKCNKIVIEEFELKFHFVVLRLFKDAFSTQ